LQEGSLHPAASLTVAPLSYLGSFKVDEAHGVDGVVEVLEQVQVAFHNNGKWDSNNGWNFPVKLN
jgi:aspartate 1-decarboxylase